jgi:hypothetical protein
MNKNSVNPCKSVSRNCLPRSSRSDTEKGGRLPIFWKKGGKRGTFTYFFKRKNHKGDIVLFVSRSAIELCRHTFYAIRYEQRNGLSHPADRNRFINFFTSVPSVASVAIKKSLWQKSKHFTFRLLVRSFIVSELIRVHSWLIRTVSNFLISLCSLCPLRQKKRIFSLDFCLKYSIIPLLFDKM